MYKAFLFNQVDVEAIKSINQKGDIFSFWNALSNFKLHFATTRSFTFSGFNLAPLGVTTLPATEKTRCSDLDEAAGTGKTTLTGLAIRGSWDSWCFHHSCDDLWASPLIGLYLHRRHFAMLPSNLSSKYLLTLDACFLSDPGPIIVYPCQWLTHWLTDSRPCWNLMSRPCWKLIELTLAD